MKTEPKNIETDDYLHDLIDCVAERDRLKTANAKILEALHIAANIQHETASMRGEIECTDETPCIFCSTIAKAEGL